MKPAAGIFILATCFASPPLTARADWQAVEKVANYAIAGKTGAELYASIGERGPKVGGGTRAIAYTNFTLTWTRKYEPQEGACVLVSARPKLTITYTLPEPSGRLPASLAGELADLQCRHARPRKDPWRHHQGHGQADRGLDRRPDRYGDPKCSKIRAEMKKRPAALSLAQRQRSKEFDQSRNERRRQHPPTHPEAGERPVAPAEAGAIEARPRQISKPGVIPPCNAAQRALCCTAIWMTDPYKAGLGRRVRSCPQSSIPAI